MEEVGIFEDLVGGDLPTRFKYRTVESNDFGLTDEEILFSDDRDLNKWCSLKKMSQYREDNEEKNDKKTYSSKAADERLKRKILKSFFERQSETKKEDNEDQVMADMNSDNQIIDEDNQKKRRKRKRKNKKSNQFIVEPIVKKNCEVDEIGSQKETTNVETDNNDSTEMTQTTEDKKFLQSKKFRKYKNKKQKNNNNESPYPGVSVDRLKAYGLSNRKIRKIKIKSKK